MASMKSRFRPSHDAKLHMLAGPLWPIRGRRTQTNQSQMIRLFFVLIILSSLNISLFAQDTTYFNSDWEVTVKNNSYYYRIDQKLNDKYSRTDYFTSTSQKQMVGQFTSLDPEIKSGIFKWFYSNGELKHIGEYKNNNETGEHIWYYDNGQIEAIENYTIGVLNGSFKEYHTNGKISIETSFVEGDQEGFTKYFRENGTLQSEGLFKKSDRFGVWKYYDEEGQTIGEEEYRTDYTIEEANMFIRFPSTKWKMTNYNPGDLTEYIFKREQITDSKGRQIIPAIMIYVEDASNFDDLTVYSFMKQKPFITKGVKIDKILINDNDNYPISYKNSFWYQCHYTAGDDEHILYMIHILTKDKTGIQILMDMTKEIAKEYESEFVETLKTIEEK